VLAEVRYVITLDTDTQLPRDSARQMVGAMAHPLNRPILDSEHRRVIAGYGIMQPRVGVSLPSAHRSWFVRLFAGESSPTRVGQFRRSICSPTADTRL
jgi:hypothetical protein